MNLLPRDDFDRFVFCIAGFSLIAFILQRLFLKGPKLNLPRIGKSPQGLFGLANARADFMSNGKRLVEEGYKKYRNSIYVVQTADMERIILSSKYADELRAYPKEVLSSVDAQCERHLASWNTLDVVKKSDLHVDVCRVHLNQHLGRMTGCLAEEVEHAITNELPVCQTSDEFEYVTANAMVMKVVSRTVNRALVGFPLCRNDTWFKTSMAYMTDAFIISSTLRPLPYLLRPFRFIFLGARISIKLHMATANKLLGPVISERVPDDPKHHDVVQWMVDGAKGKDKNPQEITHKILFLCLASMSSSTMGITHALFDFCSMRQYIESVREEIGQAIAEEGGWTLSALQRMRKLDSFLKESQRINHPGLFSFNRKVLQTVKLSDGNVLPAGTFISMPTYSIARDPAFYDSPLDFKPFRYSDIRERDPKNTNRYQFTSTGPTNLAFGYGHSSCPGRGFAAVEMKLILGHLIYEYEFKFPDNQNNRPDNIHMDERIWPSREQKIGFRKRQGVYTKK